MSHKLTPNMIKTLEVLANPELESLTVLQKCKEIGISTRTYYDYFDNPVFLAAYNKMLDQVIQEALTPIVRASIREAKKGSYQDRKLMLEVGGKYKSSVDVNVKGFEDFLTDISKEGSE